MRPYGGAIYSAGDHLGIVFKNGVLGGAAIVQSCKRLAAGFLPTLALETSSPHFKNNIGHAASCIKASDGLVENNLIEDSTIAGIAMGPEIWWGEANYCQNVVIRGNTIRHCAYASVGDWTPQAGALSICSEGDSPDARGNANIVIEQQRFCK